MLGRKERLATWKSHPDWLFRNNAAFQQLWNSYKARDATSEALSSLELPAKRARVDEYEAELEAEVMKAEINEENEYEAWKKMKLLQKEELLVQDPFQFWISHET